eukprot:7392210-Pyramimonas_sp.AAC.1
MDDGGLLAPFDISPWIVIKLVQRAIVKWQWRQASLAPGCAHLAEGGTLEPLIRLTSTGCVTS